MDSCPYVGVVLVFGWLLIGPPLEYVVKWHGWPNVVTLSDFRSWAYDGYRALIVMFANCKPT